MRPAQKGVQLADGRDAPSAEGKGHGSGGDPFFTGASSEADSAGGQQGDQLDRGKGSVRGDVCREC